ncbi:hypothetical protein Bca4012_010408 [Brassica carinata]|uniref:Uncharacterized protein n=1 Tax=Brassica carinata TaxID=52824 RepID=A0A8X7S317_BRACI|nr:hypothetical protein Bca52824_035345 [Brassica carinata]
MKSTQTRKKGEALSCVGVETVMVQSTAVNISKAFQTSELPDIVDLSTIDKSGDPKTNKAQAEEENPSEKEEEFGEREVDVEGEEEVESGKNDEKVEDIASKDSEETESQHETDSHGEVRI